MGNPEDRLDLLELWRAVWRSKWLVLSVAFACALIGATYSLFATKWYRAEVLMIPADPKSTQGLAGVLGGLGALDGLAGLAGISIGGGTTAEPLALINSPGFTRAFIEEQQLLPVLFEDEWDPRAGAWKKAKHPDIHDAVKLFDRRVRRTYEDKKTKLVTLTIEWKDPQIAANWANLLVQRLNDQMRLRALAEAERNIEYLKNELRSAELVTMQQSGGRLLEAELQKSMLARGNDEFALRVIDKASPPKWRVWPKRVQITVFSGVLGGFLAAFALIIRRAARIESKKDQ
jgi:uncharacterized protein involved in exopolysaccharide biosynthesis